MQKVINTMAVLSFLVSACVVGSGAYVYLNREAIKDNVKEQVVKGIKGAIKSQLGQVLFSDPVAPGADLPDPTRIDETGAIPIPTLSFGQ